MRMARFSPARGRLCVFGGMLGILSVVGLSAAPALATTYYDNDGCVVRQLTDGPPAGGSQCAGVNLGSKSLGQAAFQGANLAGANFSGSKLQAANFTGAMITGANFTNSQIDGADFTNTGIVPATITVPATSAAGAPIAFAAVLPQGLTDGGCFIADAPVASGTVFPVGSSGLLCKFIGAKGNAIAVVKIQVTALPTPTAPSTAAASGTSVSGTSASAGTAAPATRAPTDWGLIGGIGGGALLVLAAGVTAIVLSRRTPATALAAASVVSVPDSVPDAQTPRRGSAAAANVKSRFAPAPNHDVSLLDELIAFGDQPAEGDDEAAPAESDRPKPGL